MNRHRMKKPRHAANGTKPTAHGPPLPDESGAVSSLHAAYQVPTYDPGADDTVVRGRHAAVHSPANGHSGEGVVIVDAAANGTATIGVNGNGHAGEGVVIVDAAASGAPTIGVNGNGHAGEGAAGTFSDGDGGSHAVSDGAPGPNGPGRHSARSGPQRWRRVHQPDQRGVALLRRRIPKVVLALVVVVAVAGAAIVARAVLLGPPKVVVTTAGPSTITNQPGGVGALTEAPDNSFTVSVNLAGVQDAIFSITQVDVVNGAEVSAGAPLVQIDPTLLAQNAPQFESQLTSSEQALSAAQHAPPSTTLLGTQTQAQQIAALSVQVAFAQNLVAIAQGKTATISAPTSGSVNGLIVQPGQVVGAGVPILQIVNPSLVDVSASLLLTDLQTVTPGNAADVVPTGLPGVHLQGTVLAVSAVSTTGGLDGSVVIQCQNTSPDPVPVGAQVFVHINATQSAAVTVPSVAVLNSDLTPAVFVLRDGRVYFQPVTLGATDANRDQILSGLSAGQEVVESNMQSLTDGQTVRVVGTG